MASGFFVIALQGCAGQSAFQQGNALFNAGQTDAGLVKMEEAVRLDPGNAEYRIGLTLRRTGLLQRLLAEGNLALRENRMADAEQAYQQVLRLDPRHAMAQQGLVEVAQQARRQALIAEAETLYSQGGLAQSAPALDRLRAVLESDPGNKVARRLKDRIEDTRARETKTELRLAESFRKPIALQFNDAPLRAIFDAVSRISGLSFFFDKEVRADAKGTILARNTTVEDAVRLLLVTNQLDQKILNDNSVLIYPNTPQKQKEYQTLVVRSFFLANADVKAVSNAIKTIVKTKDLVVDERIGAIIMRDTADAVRVAERIVALQDVSDPEVMLEVEVMEIKRSKLESLGLQWPGQLTLTPLGSGTDSTGASVTTLSDLRHLRSTTLQATLSSAVINLSKQDQDANILTNPRIRVRNKEKAKILIGDRIPVITTTTSGTASFVSESVSYLDVGLKLEVEPTIYLDDDVAIKMNLEVSNLIKEIVSKSGTLSYQIGTRGASTVLQLKDGETQVLAGLISDEDRATANKVPGLGELPVLGRLFGSRTDDDQRSEILLSITPRVLRGLRRPGFAAAEFESGTENAVGQQPLLLSRVSSTPESEVSTGAPRAATDRAAEPNATASTAARSQLPPVAAAPRPGAPTAGFASVSPLAPADGAPRLSWLAPAQANVGQVFSVLLRGQGAGAWHELPLLIGYDPQTLQLIEVRPGTLFDPADGSGSLLQQGDGQQGQIRLTLARPADAVDAAPGASSAPAELLVMTFKPLRAAGSTALRLLQAEPQPAPSSPLPLPAEHMLRVMP